eukprot:8922568-Lingulodinium_polyedra.AAC.1
MCTLDLRQAIACKHRCCQWVREMCIQFFATKLDTDFSQLGSKELMSPFCQVNHVRSELETSAG